MDTAFGSSGAVTRDRIEQLEPQIRHLSAGASLGFTATAVNSLILAGVLRNEVESRYLLGWWLSLAVVTAVRFVFVRRFDGSKMVHEEDARWWLTYFDLGIGISGILWGLSGVLLFPSSVPHQTFIAFVLGGMVAGAAATFSARMQTFLFFSIPALAPLIVQLLRQGSEFNLAMGIMVFLFGLLLTATAVSVNRQLMRTEELTGNIRELQRELKEASKTKSAPRAIDDSVRVSGQDREIERFYAKALRQILAGELAFSSKENMYRLAEGIEKLNLLLESAEVERATQADFDAQAKRVAELEQTIRAVSKRMSQINVIASGHASVGAIRAELDGDDDLAETLKRISQAIDDVASLANELIVCADQAQQSNVPGGQIELTEDGG